MKIILFIILLCNANFALAEDFDVYCKKTIKGTYTSKRKRNICWCAEENLRLRVTADERLWLIQRALPKSKNAREQASAPVIPEVSQKRLRDVEFEIFKNCSTNYKWKANADDIGVPDDITSP